MDLGALCWVVTGAKRKKPPFLFPLCSASLCRVTSRRASMFAGVPLCSCCLVHNHPSGDPTPSRADIDMTKTIVDTAKPLGITVHDHIIIGKDGHASLKGLRLI